MDDTTQILIVIKQSTNLELKNCFLAWNGCEIVTHSQQKPQAPNAHKKRPTIRLTTRVTMLWDPQRSLLYRLLVSVKVKCKTHTQQSKAQVKKLRLANLTENAERHTLLLVVALRMHLTLTYCSLHNQCEY